MCFSTSLSLTSCLALMLTSHPNSVRSFLMSAVCELEAVILSLEHNVIGMISESLASICTPACVHACVRTCVHVCVCVCVCVFICSLGIQEGILHMLSSNLCYCVLSFHLFFLSPFPTPSHKEFLTHSNSNAYIQ